MLIDIGFVNLVLLTMTDFKKEKFINILQPKVGLVYCHINVLLWTSLLGMESTACRLRRSSKAVSDNWWRKKPRIFKVSGSD